MAVVLVHYREVIEHVLLLLNHAPQAILDDDRQFVVEGGVVGDAVGNHGRLQVAVAVLVLQAFAVERGAAGGAPQQEPPGPGVAGGPGQVADALEAEHGVVDVEGDHLHVVRAVGGGGGDPGTEGAGLVDAFFQDLAALVFPVIHDLVGIHRLVELAGGRIDAHLTEQTFHAEGAGFIRDDGHHVTTQRFVPQQAGEDAHEGHGGGDLALAGGFQHGLEVGQGRRFQGLGPGAPGGQVAAQGGPAGLEIFHFRAVLRRPVERQVFQLIVAHGNLEAVAEGLEVGQGHFLGLVGGVLGFAGGAHAVTLHGLGQDHRGLAGVLHRRRVGRVDLVGVVAAPVQAPDVLVGHGRHHFLELGIFAEEMLPGVGAALGLEILVLAIHALFHAVAQDTLAVHGQERIPVGAPEHLDHVPARAPEGGFQFLHDLAVAAHRAVQALQVAVDDEDQVVELLPGGQGQGTQGFRFVGLAVAQEGPDMAARGVGDAPVVQIFEEACLVDGLQGAQTHGHGGELPELGHEPRVGVGGQPVSAGFLAEVGELGLADAALQEGPGVYAGRRVALEEHQIAAMGSAVAVEEVVEAHLIKRGGGLEAGDVAAHARGLFVGAHDAGHRVPADQGLDAGFHGHVARVLFLQVHRDGVHIGGGGVVRQIGAGAAGLVHQAFQQVVGAFDAFLLDDGGEGIEPLPGFLGIGVRAGIRHVKGLRTKVRIRTAGPWRPAGSGNVMQFS